ncbi:MAG: glycosyltransferase, partial [Zymomonas mobilis]
NLSLVKSPSKIHQIMIVDGGKIPSRLPELFQINSEEIKGLHKNIPYKMWGGDDVRELIKNNFNKGVLDSYDVLVPYAYKCDLARLCVLYVEGGLYVDLGVKLLREFKVPLETEFSTFRDLYQETNGFMMQNGLIFSEKNRPELLHAIQWIAHNCNHLYYGLNSLYPTGPVQLGRAVAFVSATSGPGGSPSQWIGECRAITPSESNKNMIYTDPYGNLTALRAKIHAGDLAHMGLKGGNNHNLIWQKRQVYGEKISIWKHDDKQIQLTGGGVRTPEGITVNKYQFGRFTYGPYIQLTHGNYTLEIKLRASTKFSKLFVEVCNQGGDDEIFKGFFDNVDGSALSIKIKFFIDHPCQSVEVRLSNEHWFDGFIEEIAISPLLLETKIFDTSTTKTAFKLRTESGFLTESGIFNYKGNPGKIAIADLKNITPGFYTAIVKFQKVTKFQKIKILIMDGSNPFLSQEFGYQDLQKDDSVSINFSVSKDLIHPILFLESGDDFEGCIKTISIVSGNGRSGNNNQLIEMLGIGA